MVFVAGVIQAADELSRGNTTLQHKIAECMQAMKSSIQGVSWFEQLRKTTR